MLSNGKGSIRLGKIAGITLFLHWSWFVVALLEINVRRDAYRSVAWNVAEYLALFAIVLLHEFGHAFACRQTGGKADQIVLWPLGGVAFVNPPPRPGALLWSVAAGPLVNVLLVPVTLGLCLLVWHVSPHDTLTPLKHFCVAVTVINIGLLVFNLLPIYPLDGGQILYALLWFVLGRSRGLMVASFIGLVGAAGVLVPALIYQRVWFIVLAAFLGLQALAGLRQARMLAWLQPAVEHFQRAMASLQQEKPAEAVALCDEALKLVPPGQRIRDAIEHCRAAALAKMNAPIPAEVVCPSCQATVTPLESPGAYACGNCGWKSGA